ncbi:MAG: cell wall hydrolase [Clostridiales bacterium]|nr:cell wall hydrolase [Clostridiales bacterium]MDY4171871.1 cell wall hydrolase [Evtepia sp.]
MRKHLPSAIILFVLLLALCFHAFAADNKSYSGTSTLAPTRSGYLFSSTLGIPYTAYADVIDPVTTGNVAAELRTTPDITVNGTSIAHKAILSTIDGVSYLSAAPVLTALFPQADITLEEGRLTASGENLRFEAIAGEAYFMVNDRYFYAPSLVAEQDGHLLLPVQSFTKALGCTAVTDQETGELIIRLVGPAATAGTYNEEDLYWLSRAIYSESGNQPMKGRIAVGTVILNRVANEAFPNTIKEVVFAPGQFSPVANGTIYLEPDQRSVIAAKLCLDGVREAKDCLYFNVTTMYSWADRSRTYFCTIGGHNFYL